MIKEKIIKSERIVYFDACPKCNDDIKGFSIVSYKLNLKSHLEKHEREKIKFKEKLNNSQRIKKDGDVALNSHHLDPRSTIEEDKNIERMTIGVDNQSVDDSLSQQTEVKKE